MRKVIVLTKSGLDALSEFIEIIEYIDSNIMGLTHLDNSLHIHNEYMALRQLQKAFDDAGAANGRVSLMRDIYTHDISPEERLKTNPVILQLPEGDTTWVQTLFVNEWIEEHEVFSLNYVYPNPTEAEAAGVELATRLQEKLGGKWEVVVKAKPINNTGFTYYVHLGIIYAMPSENGGFYSEVIIDETEVENHIWKYSEPKTSPLPEDAVGAKVIHVHKQLKFAVDKTNNTFNMMDKLKL